MSWSCLATGSTVASLVAVALIGRFTFSFVDVSLFERQMNHSDDPLSFSDYGICIFKQIVAFTFSFASPLWFVAY